MEKRHTQKFIKQIMHIFFNFDSFLFETNIGIFHNQIRSLIQEYAKLKSAPVFPIWIKKSIHKEKRMDKPTPICCETWRSFHIIR